MDTSKQALLPKAHCRPGRVAPECRAHHGINAAASLVGRMALVQSVAGFERQDISASCAATRERYMQA